MTKSFYGPFFHPLYVLFRVGLCKLYNFMFNIALFHLNPFATPRP